MNEMIFLTKEEVRSEIRQSVKDVFKELEMQRKQYEMPKLFTKNAVAKRLHLSHATVSRLCSNGTIRTTKSGLIEESEIESYLSNK